jgi:hypothetical protein
MISFTGKALDEQQLKKVKGQPGFREDDRSNPLHRQLIGHIGLFLPLILIFMAICRDGWVYWKKLDSVSAYYYSGAAAAFVGMLVALSLFLFTYRGFGNKFNWADRVFSVIAGLAALCVAVFPTGAPDKAHELSWWMPYNGIVHVVSAVVLFLMFAVFALFLFPIRAEGDEVQKGKRRRNRVYYICGAAILASMAWAVVNWKLKRHIFWPESFALIFFAASWLTKGRIDASIASTVRFIFRRKGALKK